MKTNEENKILAEFYINYKGRRSMRYGLHKDGTVTMKRVIDDDAGSYALDSGEPVRHEFLSRMMAQVVRVPSNDPGRYRDFLREAVLLLGKDYVSGEKHPENQVRQKVSELVQKGSW